MKIEFAKVTKHFVVTFILLAATAAAAGVEQSGGQSDNQSNTHDVDHGDNKYSSVIGQVVSVPSGDSVQILLPDGELISVKLAGIKSPSPEDPVGSLSQRWLSSQLHQQLVSAECMQHDQMLHCVVFPDDRNINLISLYHGYSRCNDKESPVDNRLMYQLAERRAREAKAGVWNQQ